MAECVICQIINGDVPSKKIFEDNDKIAFLDVNGAAPGHTFIVPKEHFPIMEQIPDELVAQLFSLSNKISTGIFETLNVQGTNVFVTNGVSAGQSVAHFVINVIPRNQGDGINLEWQTKQLSEEEMSTVELKIKEFTENVGAVKSDSTNSVKQETIATGQNNYFWKTANRRIP